MPKIGPPPVIQTNFNTQTTTLYSTAFLICDTNSTASIVIHISQLVPNGRIDTVCDIPFHDFLQNVSEQLGFDVKGRIHAVVLMGLAIAFVKNDYMMKVNREKQWRAALQLWQNAEKATCEFNVEKKMDD